MAWNRQCKLKRALEKLYKAEIYRLQRELRNFKNQKALDDNRQEQILTDLEIAEDDLNIKQNQNIANQQLILNLNQQIFALQNNNLHINNNRTGMVGYELKKFNGYSTEDPEEHIEEFRL